jgi:GNAT superfamily N-acetyltransferase
MIRRCDDHDFERDEINDGVVFWGYDDSGTLAGVMGIQDVQDVTLIRHAYVRTSSQKRGIGGRLLGHLLGLSNRPVLIGTWATAVVGHPILRSKWLSNG